MTTERHKPVLPMVCSTPNLSGGLVCKLLNHPAIKLGKQHEDNDAASFAKPSKMETML